MHANIEKLERDAICRAALATWLKAGAPAGQLMSHVAVAERRVRLPSGAAPSSIRHRDEVAVPCTHHEWVPGCEILTWGGSAYRGGQFPAPTPAKQVSTRQP